MELSEESKYRLSYLTLRLAFDRILSNADPGSKPAMLEFLDILAGTNLAGTGLFETITQPQAAAITADHHSAPCHAVLKHRGLDLLHQPGTGRIAIRRTVLMANAPPLAANTSRASSQEPSIAAKIPQSTNPA